MTTPATGAMHAPPTRRGWAPVIDWIRIGADVAVVVTVAVMVWIYFAGRSDAEHMRRQEMTASLLAMKYDEALRGPQQRVNKYFTDARGIYDKAYIARIAGKPYPAQDIPPEIRADLQKLTDYYADIASCAANNLCDAQMVELWFKNDIHAFACHVYLVGLPELRQSLGDSYGAALVAYAGKCGPN
ncbi:MULTISPECIES: hypothetical protein [unclassified Sphingomonas]|uniref:hypothetical protein n=1 Tax=Sphingomonas TaxID=13687 RepID=UPI000960EFC8|nr:MULTISPECIES: hypothetical protein [unclassified Sphingomonas]MBN8811681.1 hypothetical protein [Sphingomonas sp.]OJY49905.1 MAG: hypothetical protein BGP17_17610 [Sphingomonas sp. 67-41]